MKNTPSCEVKTNVRRLSGYQHLISSRHLFSSAQLPLSTKGTGLTLASLHLFLSIQLLAAERRMNASCSIATPFRFEMILMNEICARVGGSSR